MPPPHDGNEYTHFEELMRLHTIDENTFQSIALPFSPGGQLRAANPRAYGGHVYAQAAWACCQTVNPGFLLYNIVGHFHLPGSRTTPFVYKIARIRDGRSYATRNVAVTIQGQHEACFTATVSFKKAEESVLDVQEHVDLWKKYHCTLEGKRPSDFEDVPGMDVPWYWKLRKETGKNDQFPGLESKKVDMTRYNTARHPLDRRGLIFYRPLGLLPPDPNLHLCAHAYASDRNSLYIVANQMDVGDLWTSMSSLIHSVSFYGPIERFLFRHTQDKGPMDDSSGSGRWFCKEDGTLRVGHGRAYLFGRLWASDGTNIAVISQDGMIRYTQKPRATEDELGALRDRESQWPPRVKM